ncbi:MAG: ribonuclease P protein component [Candidatus Pacebacteria bacterium]|nr:ribonuclease P protein component [Candidatus Paceibacterota bacterium]
MPPRLSRLPKQEFLSRGFRVVKTPYFSLKQKKNDIQKNRFGAIIGKAVHKSAVERNFLRRQAREGISKTISSGNDILVIFAPAANKLTKRRLHEELAKAAAQLQK